MGVYLFVSSAFLVYMNSDSHRDVIKKRIAIITLATWCKQLTHLKRPWCWERLRAGERDDRGRDSWMASPTQWTWVWVNSGSWWWTGRPGVLQSMGSQRVRHYWATELNWTELAIRLSPFCIIHIVEPEIY